MKKRLQAMPLIGTWQADGLAPIEAFRISSPSQLSADGKLGGGLGLSSGALEETALRGRIRGSAVTTCHNKSCMHCLCTSPWTNTLFRLATDYVQMWALLEAMGKPCV